MSARLSILSIVGALVTTGCQPESDAYVPTDPPTNFDVADPNEAPVCATKPAAARLVRRLSLQEYTNTVQDLVGEVPTVTFAGDGAVDGFDNNAATLTVGSVLADQYRIAAEDLAARAVADHWQQMMPCTEETRACAAEFVQSFGTRAYRRPLSAGESDAYMSLYDEIVAEDGFEETIRWMLTAFLESPYFLYRTELGSRTDGSNTFALSDWEIASELSYLVWGTMPDQRLFDLAAAGELHTSEQISNEVERLVLSPKAAPAVARFFRLWLPTERVRDVVKSDEIYPGFTPEIRDAMIAEFDHDVEDAYWNGLGISELLTADFTYLTPELAEYYGLDIGSETPDPDGWRRVDLSGTGQGGILTRGALMASLATPTTSSPIHRGKFVRQNLLCQTMPPPPNDIQISVPEYTEGTTTRELYEGYTLANEDCAGCHELMDPIGFGFENFDGDGVWRETDQGKTVDSSGQIARSPHSDGSFSGPLKLEKMLAASTDVEKCFVKNWLEYGTGVPVQIDETCTDEVALAAQDAGGGLMGTLVTLASTSDFRARLGDATDSDGPAPAVAK